MRITDEMIAEDEKRWHARDVVMELDYCSTYMRDRKDITNLDIRFYAYIMRKARDLLKAQEPRVMTLEEVMALEEGTGDVWIEDAPMPYTSYWIEAVTLVNKTDWQKTDEVTFSNEITYHPTSYRLNTAQGWRCWTGRPTEEQVKMKAWVEVIGGNEDDA